MRKLEDFRESLLDLISSVTALSARHHPDCYPSDPVQTLAFFRDAFASCPAHALPPAPKKSSFVGVVTPHIDFRVSLRAYAAAFRPLLEKPLADTSFFMPNPRLK